MLRFDCSNVIFVRCMAGNADSAGLGASSNVNSARLSARDVYSAEIL